MGLMTDDAFVRWAQGHLGVTADGLAGDATRAAFLKAIGSKEPVAPPPLVTLGGQPLDTRSEAKLAGVHPDLVAVMRLAALTAPVPFVVLEGVRSLERQQQLVASGASQTMRSRHLKSPTNGYSHAVDIAPLGANGQVSWDWPLYHRLAPAVKQAAVELGIPIEWGADWVTFKDGPHWQLPWAKYP